VAYWVQYGALDIAGNPAWRLCFALQLVPGVVVGVYMFFRPESPRWLLQNGREAEATRILANLHGNGDPDSPLVRVELAEIKTVIELEVSSSSPSYWALLSGKEYRRRTWLAVGIQAMQQLSGGNIVLYYAAKVFAQTGRDGPTATMLANGINSAVVLVGTVSLTIMIDRYGRRKPIFLGPICMGTCLIVVGSILVGFGAPSFNTTTQAIEFSFSNVSAGSAALAFIFLFQFLFGALSSSIPWTYQSEVFPLAARARGTSLSTSTNYMVNFWLGLYMPEALNVASWKVYFVFGGINMACAVIGYLFYPETCGRTLEEVDLLFTPDRESLVFMDKEATKRRPAGHNEIFSEDPTKAAEMLRQGLHLPDKEDMESDSKTYNTVRRLEVKGP
jgi:sugar porter (SP) family MFS transporter